MFENNQFYDYPTQVVYQFVGERDEYKGIAYGEIIIDIASGEVIFIGNDINIIHVSESWSPYFMD